LSTPTSKGRGGRRGEKRKERRMGWKKGWRGREDWMLTGFNTKSHPDYNCSKCDMNCLQFVV